MSKKQHAASLADVVQKYVTRAIEEQGLEPASTEDAHGHNWTFNDFDQDSAMTLSNNLLAAIVKDLSGSHEAAFVRPDGSQLPLRFQPPFNKKKFLELVKEGSGQTFDIDAFPVDDPNTAMLLELMYNRFLEQLVEQPYTVTHFPQPIARQHEGIEAQRMDVACMGQRLMTGRTWVVDGKPRTQFLVSTHAVAMLLASLADVQTISKVLPKEWTAVQEYALDNVPDLLDEVGASMETLWQQVKANQGGMTQKKVAYLMNIVGGDIVSCIRSAVHRALAKNAAAAAEGEGTGDGRRGSEAAGARASMDKGGDASDPSSWETNRLLFEAPWPLLRRLLAKSVKVTEKWLKMCQLLTGERWKGEWQGPPHVDATVRGFSRRLEDLARLRAMHDQLFEVLAKNELLELGGPSAWQSFVGIDVLSYSPYTQKNWDDAVEAFDAMVIKHEGKIARKLRQLCQQVEERRGAMLTILTQLQDLVKRKGVAEELVADRETMLAHFIEMLSEMGQFYTEIKKDTSVHGHARVNAFCVQSAQAAEQIQVSAKALLGDLPKLDRVSSACDAFQKKLADMGEKNYEAFEKKFREKSQIKEPVVITMVGTTLEESAHKPRGRMYVKVSQWLLHLMEEVRVMEAVGMPLKVDVKETTQKLSVFYRHAVDLRRVAGQWNMIANHVLKSQRPLLMKQADRIEELIRRHGAKYVITLDKVPELETLVNNLKNEMGEFALENRKLLRLHQQFTEKVVGLLRVDLLHNTDKWHATIKDMKSQFESLERTQGYNGMDMWVQHWDVQLYKALEHQYQLGLETLNENLGTMECEMSYKSGMIIFNPSFETLREQYFEHVRAFLDLPSTMEGLTGQPVFQNMIGRNSAYVAAVYKNADNLFQQLKRLQRKFRDYTIIGSIWNLDDLLEGVLEQLSDWERNYVKIENKRREVDDLPDVVDVDCFKVNLVPLKTTAHEQLNRLVGYLRHSLQSSAEGHLEKVGEFINQSMSQLSDRPTTVEQIGNATDAVDRMTLSRPTLQREFDSFDMKNAFLKQINGGEGVDATVLRSKWDRFAESIETFKSIMAEQKEKMKTMLDGGIKAFQKQIKKFESEWEKNKPKKLSAYSSPSEIQEKVVLYVRGKRAELAELRTKAEEFSAQCVYFQMARPDFGALDKIEVAIDKSSEEWKHYIDFMADINALTEEPFMVFRNKYGRFEDALKEWAEKLKEKDVVQNEVTDYVQNMLIERWLNFTPAIKFIRGDGWTPEHWDEMFKLIGMQKGMTREKLKFGDYLDRYAVILENLEAIKQLHARAGGEATVRDSLAELRKWAAENEFAMFDKESGDGKRMVPLIKDWKDLIMAVGDKMSLVTTLRDSRFYNTFADEINGWERKFGLLNECLGMLMNIQRKWVYLEPIFQKGALPSEASRFKKVDGEFVNILRRTKQEQHVISMAKHTDLPNTLKTVTDQLDRCQKALMEFMEEKRGAFPRFYFIGDDDLLEILGQSTNPKVIQSHLKKLFAGIAKVEFDEEVKHITKMLSSAGEKVPLAKPVQIVDFVEVWLRELDIEMKQTLRAMSFDCYNNYDFVKYPGSMLGLVKLIMFTKDAEAAITSNSIPALKQKVQDDLAASTAPGAYEQTDRVQELKMKSLIMDYIHNRDVCQQLMDEKTNNLMEWQWQKQIRFYMDTHGDVPWAKIRMVDASFLYTYEYQGNAAKLVHTPLTDKCYLTLTQGQHLGYGGNPFGPAGTGKTESVKALGNAMGRQVLVFNCDEGIDFKSMGRIFQGLCKCGAWGCFDEFNRLKPDQLSAVSTMIQAIQAALKTGQEDVLLMGKMINLDLSAGIFVTLNPAGKHYGGRSQLPDNLKQLFRAVAMSIPDNELITETMLFSEGFSNAKAVAKKMVEVFLLSKQLLSVQVHYDWGLRSLKSILTVGGALIQQEKLKHYKAVDAAKAEGKEAPSTRIGQLDFECELVIKALRVNTLSKLTSVDRRKFNELVDAVFPGVTIAEIDYGDLIVAIKEVYAEERMQLLDNQVHKICQLYEAANTRMGVGIVGPSGSGKSTLIRVLRKALIKMKRSVPFFVMNPKAMPRHLLLGFMDNDTREWNDGVLTAASRKVVVEPSDARCWILCDGDIDPEWIESLNSVLDDNRLLTMPNGERIQFGDNVNFLFETHSLQFASPATVSRMNIIFLEEQDVDIMATINGWIIRQDWLKEKGEKAVAQMTEWIEKYFAKALEKLERSGKVCVETTRMGLVVSGLSHLVGVENRSMFALGLSRGFGAYLDPEARTEFVQSVFQLCDEKLPDTRNPLNVRYDGGFKTYQYGVSLRLKKADLLANSMIETVSVQTNLDLVRPWIHSGAPFIVVGPEGAGKSMLLNNCFRELDRVEVATIFCNAQTSAVNVIDKLNQVCAQFSSSDGKVLRPKGADRLILYLKDLNLPKPDMYATSMLHSLLQQLILYQGFYANDLEWIRVEKVQIVASMNPSGGVGRYPVASRFTALTSVVYVGYPHKDELSSVYQEYVHAYLISALDGNAKWRGGKDADKIAKTMVDLYLKVKERFLVDDRSHYIFTPRDVTAWVLNLFNYDMEKVELPEAVGYEAERIFGDRLATEAERQVFQKLLEETLKAPVQYKSTAESPYFVSAAAGGKDKKEDKAKAKLGKKLNPVAPKEYAKMLDKAITVFQREARDLNLVLVPEVMKWIARTDRIFSKPGGHLLFAGRSGIGRKDICLLVAHMLKMPTYTLNMTPGYSLKSFKADIKAVLESAAVRGEDTIFFIEDQHTLDPQYLELVNSLLASSEIPGLFTAEENDTLLSGVKDAMMDEGFMGTSQQFFLQRVATKLHVVLIFDYLSPRYELNCQSNPAIYTKCSVQWLDSLSTETMKVMPPIFLPRIRNELIIQGGGEVVDERGMTDAQKKAAAESAKIDEGITPDVLYIHQSLGSRATPRNFTNVQHAYQKVYNAKFISLRDDRARLEGGLSKLDEAEQQVAELSKKAQKQKKELEVKQKEADTALTEIQTSMEQAAVEKKKAQTLEKAMQKESEVIAKAQVNISEKLSGVEPVLKAARDALGAISPKDLNEIKSLASPPKTIESVLSGVLALLGSTDFSWKAMKGFLGKSGVVQQITGLDATQLNKADRSKAEEMLKKGGDAFKPEVAAKASKACAPLALWCSAMVQYSQVHESITPLLQEKSKLEESAKEAQSALDGAVAKVKDLDAKVEEMTKRFKKMTSEAAKLQAKLEKEEQTLADANALIGKLSGEKTRWSETCKSLTKSIDVLPRLALLCGAYMTYLASDEEDFRVKMMTEWSNKLQCKDFEFRRFMRTEAEILEWKAQGLPGDALSADNAICILETIAVPLIIDPAGQAGEWLRKTLEGGDATVEVTSYAEDRFMNILELAVRFGKTLIIQDVDQVDPVLYPILRKDFTMVGTKRVVPCGDKVVDYGETFKLYLVTRNPNIDLPPDAVSLVSATNFCITRAGLEGQLLQATIGYEKPELEEQKSALLQTEEGYKIELASLEDRLLHELATSTGSLLENESLISALNEIKTKSQTIEESQQQAKQAQEDIDAQRNAYRPFARQGSLAFFALQDLRGINHMYQYSLGYFMTLFKGAMNVHKDKKMNDIPSKVVDLIAELNRITYVNVLRSLFKADRLMFGVHFAYAVEKAKVTEDVEEWKQFTGTGKPPDSSAKPADWMDTDQAPAFQVFSANLPALVKEVGLSSSTWKDWSRGDDIEKMPSGVKVTDFQKLLLVQCLRPDRLAGMLESFVLRTLNVTAIPPTNIGAIIDTQSTNDTPVLFITTPGADPSQELMEVGVNRVGSGAYNELAMGGGQMEAASDLLKRCSAAGEWLTLKNLHLVVGWLPQLEKELSLLTPHENFRLFLTSEATSAFPAIMLKNALKLTFESPPGVKKNLLATYDGWNPEWLKSLDEKHAQLLFSLAWMHAIVQERRAYCPQGFTQAYEFNPADLRASADMLAAQCKLGKNGVPDWDTVYGLMNFAIYAGRIDNEFDVRTVVSYLKQYFNDDVLAGKAKLWKNLGQPKGNIHDGYVKAIEAVPDTNTPDMFVLSANADRLVAKTAVDQLVANLRRLGGAGDAGGEVRFNREVWRAALTPLFSAWQTLTEKESAKVFSAPVEEDTKAGPIQSFVEMERNFALGVCRTINRQISDLKKVIDGTLILSQSLAKLAGFLMKDETPPSWDRLWEGPEQVVGWLTLVVKKTIALESWVTKARNKSLMGGTIRLDELFRPNTLLNALKQETAAAGKASLDSLKLDCAWGKANLKGCALPMKVEGLLVQCMKFDKSDALVDLTADAPGSSAAPVATFGWVTEPAKGSQLVGMPVYFNSSRDKLLCKVSCTVKVCGCELYGVAVDVWAVGGDDASHHCV